MGPFWSLKPSPAGAQNIRMVVRNGDEPVLYTLSIYLGHLSLSDLVAAETTPKPVCSTTVTRFKKSADVRRIPVKEGNVRGTLFLPPGGCCWNRAANRLLLFFGGGMSDAVGLSCSANLGHAKKENDKNSKTEKNES